MPTEPDDDEPQPDKTPKERPSADAYGLANLAGCLSQTAAHLLEVSRRLDAATGDERRDIAAQLEPELGEIGDLGHEARRVVGAMVRGEGG